MMKSPNLQLEPSKAYRSLWNSGQHPDIEKFVEANSSLPLEKLLDIILTDQLERWLRNDEVKADFYLRRFPSIRKEFEFAASVIYGEYCIRRDRGDQPSLTEYMHRYPKYAARIREQVMWSETLQSFDKPTTDRIELPSFDIKEELGKTQTCVVYRGVDQKTKKDIAIKTVRSSMNLLDEVMKRFDREMDLCRRLDHPNIVKTLSVGTLKDRPYIVMEYCSLGNLTKKIARKPLPEDEALSYFLEIASAVKYAHSLSIIHRDLKPSNVLLVPSRFREGSPAAKYPTAKVADFGLAKCKELTQNAESITDVNTALGTPCYVAPEQLGDAKNVDHRADVYGLGAILFEMLTGLPPFIAPSPEDVFEKVLHEKPQSPCELNPLLSIELGDICLRCLQKKPLDRIQNVAALIEEILHFQKYGQIA